MLSYKRDSGKLDTKELLGKINKERKKGREKERKKEMGGNSSTRTEMYSLPTLLLPVLLLELLLAASVMGAVAASATSSSTTTSYLHINNGTLLIRDKAGLVLPLLASTVYYRVLMPGGTGVGPNHPGQSYIQSHCDYYRNPECHN
jgi:hypothetical protein